MASSRLQSIEIPQRRNWRRNSAIAASVDAARVLAGLDRVVLGRQAEGVVAHRVDDPEAVAAPVVGHRVADRVDLQVADVGLPRGIGQHLQHVALRLRLVEARLAGVGHLPGALPLPHLLPAALDLLRVVAVHGA